MPKMRNGWISLSLVLGLIVGGLPAQASEVVKLARLVVSGKRTTSETSRPPATEPRSSAGTNAPAGGGDDTGTVPTPTRGIS